MTALPTPSQSWQVLPGDCLELLRSLADASVDAVVTDPPYGLSFMGKRWDYDVPSVEIWAEALRVLKPGGHLLAFAGTRTQHRMAVRIEDAGFEIRDMIAWVYGQGFPKSHNLKGDWEGWGTALKPSLEPITVARKPFRGTVAQNVEAHGTGALNIAACRVGDGEDRASGGRSGGPARNGIYHDKGRVERATGGRWPANLLHDGSAEVVGLFPETTTSTMKPGTIQHQRTYNVAKGVQAERVREGYCGDTGSAARFFYCAKADRAERNQGLNNRLDSTVLIEIKYGYSNNEVLSWENQALKVRLRVDTAQYPPKVTEEYTTQPKGVSEWNTFLFGSGTMGAYPQVCKSTTRMETNSTTVLKTLSCWIASRIKESTQDVNCEMVSGGSHAESAALCNISVSTIREKTAYLLGVSHARLPMQFAISASESPAPKSNNHETVKPVDLMRWLCRLVTPPGGLVLDPFTGSGSTGVACGAEGFRFLGMEREEQYVEIARRRIAAAYSQGRLEF